MMRKLKVGDKVRVKQEGHCKNATGVVAIVYDGGNVVVAHDEGKKIFCHGWQLELVSE